MARKNGERRRGDSSFRDPIERLHPDARKSIWALLFLGGTVILALAGFHKAGPAGEMLFNTLEALFGWGYFVLPVSFLMVSLVLFMSHAQKFLGLTFFGALLFLLSALGTIDVFAPGKGGMLGFIFGSLKYPFGETAAVVINAIIFVIAIVVTLNIPLRFQMPKKEMKPILPGIQEDAEEVSETENEEKEDSALEKPIEGRSVPPEMRPAKKMSAPIFKNYVPPPLELLKSSVEKPTTGDLRANANIIKRTLDGFGIPVEMSEINIGPKVTRYTLKPAEGVKLSRITALNPDLALALAAHPIRIEAPIPGKSLVGIEVPNKSAAIVRLGSLITYPEFNSDPLGFVLGRDVSGDPIFANLEKMPHLLIAGATGSGKSVAIHSLLISLLYKNSPAMLRLILIDPKRVELSIYENMPHLVSPVITESKKAAAVFRWAIGEMERRYELLQAAGSRDIKSYNQNSGKDDPLPYMVLVIDELADLMTSYGREVESSIVRLAQMARATGIHLVLATQRPSVEVITGLIKANITSRIALQVASQIDSRTILDTSGAEKLLGGGDLLFVSSDLSKPKRIQGAYISEEEINVVADFIRENNQAVMPDSAVTANAPEEVDANSSMFDDYLAGDDDELYDEAVRVVTEAQKASASLLQRRLKVGYARAARLLDLMEGKGVIGPGDGAKPRDVFMDKIGDIS